MHIRELSHICNKTDNWVIFVTVGQQIRKRRKELKMSVDELASRIGKDRSTIYRYEKGNIEHIPHDVLLLLIEVLKVSPNELFNDKESWQVSYGNKPNTASTIPTSNEWLSDRAERCFDAMGGYEFNEKETTLFFEIVKYIMKMRDSEDYEENINGMMVLFKQLNQ